MSKHSVVSLPSNVNLLDSQFTPVRFYNILSSDLLHGQVINPFMHTPRMDEDQLITMDFNLRFYNPGNLNGGQAQVRLYSGSSVVIHEFSEKVVQIPDGSGYAYLYASISGLNLQKYVLNPWQDNLYLNIYYNNGSNGSEEILLMAYNNTTYDGSFVSITVT